MVKYKCEECGHIDYNKNEWVVSCKKCGSLEIEVDIIEWENKFFL